MIISNTVRENIELFRIMPLERFLQLLVTGCNTLVRPYLWEDPYERLLSKSNVSIQDKLIPFDETRWYGQCWTYSNGSDALWRAFTNGKNARAVLIKTTSDAIKESLKDVETNSRVFFLEKVEYPEPQNKDKVIDKLRGTYKFKWMLENGYCIDISKLESEDENIMAVPMLLTKLPTFRYEQEIRLLCYHKKKQPQKEETFSYELPSLMNFLKDEVVLDPWTPEGIDETLKDVIDRYIPNNSLDVRKSDMYKEWESGFTYIPNI